MDENKHLRQLDDLKSRWNSTRRHLEKQRDEATQGWVKKAEFDELQRKLDEAGKALRESGEDEWSTLESGIRQLNSVAETATERACELSRKLDEARAFLDEYQKLAKPMWPKHGNTALDFESEIAYIDELDKKDGK